MCYEITETVKQVGNISIKGNVIPPNWYRKLTFPEDKRGRRRPNHVAVTLLSDIVYWYRPTTERDEASGLDLPPRKKFKGDFLQRSKEAFADAFGFTKREVGDALKFLEEYGLITRHYRTVTTNEGLKLSNVLFVQLHADALKRLQKCDSYYDQTPPPSNAQTSDPIAPKRHTNTESTTDNTSKRKKGGIPPNPPRAPHVSTSNDEHRKLAEEYGEELRDQAYQVLSEWKEDTPKRKWKKSDYRSIRRWVIDSIKEKQAKRTGSAKGYQQKNRANPNLTEEERSQYDF